jgi:hypothetical protein
MERNSEGSKKETSQVIKGHGRKVKLIPRQENESPAATVSVLREEKFRRCKYVATPKKGVATPNQDQMVTKKQVKKAEERVDRVAASKGENPIGTIEKEKIVWFGLQWKSWEDEQVPADAVFPELDHVHPLGLRQAMGGGGG